MVALCHDSGRVRQGVEFARRLVKLDPWNHMYFGRLAHMLGQLGQFPEAIEAGRRAAELRPGNAGIHGWLSEAYGIAGDRRKAAEHRALFEKLGPRRF